MRSGRAWTAEQLRAIERRDGDLLLDASAGSGKTSVLVERFARAVLEDGVEVSSILTITFTEKAAAELRDRIRGRLRELGALEQARATEGAFISTIHGFCARVLRTSALTAGLDPNFVVLDRYQSEPLAAAAFDDGLQELARSGGAVDLIADYGAAQLRAAIVSVYAQLRSDGQLRPRLPPCPPPPGPEAAPELGEATLALAAELGAIRDPSPKVANALGRLERCRELLLVADLWPAELERVKLPGNGAALSTDACVAYREALARYRAACAARAAAPVRDLMDALLAAYGEHYAERKREISGVDFEDLELITRELLRTRDELREHYATRFQRIMVDELQDTNRVQLELIEAIARGNLFTVGDAQQSIYRFRHADVELFERRGERLAASDERETLQTNFRSRAEILEALNLAFDDQLGQRFKPLVAGRLQSEDDGEAGDPDPRVELLLVDKGADWELEGIASPWRLAEARALAARVAELVAAGTAPGEVVVLTRATTDMRAYGRGYWSHPQVLDLVAYLRALANPRDEQSLYTVLASPLVGASLDALVVLAGGARARDRDPWWILREPGDELSSLGDEDRRALGLFASWFAQERARAARSGIEDLIDRALERTGYDLAMLAMPGGRRRLANVRKLMRLAGEYEREQGPDLRGFLELVSEREAGRAADSRESEAPVEGEGLDAVRLMTIHRAKGLEFNTVCVADLGRSTRPPYEILRVAADGRFGLRLIRSGVAGRASALDYDAIGAEEKQADESEERRLFYVAMTRAQERLILSGATRFEGWAQGRGTGGGPVTWIAPAFVPELAQRIAEGGGVVQHRGARMRLRIAAPEDRTTSAPVIPSITVPEPAPPPAIEPPPMPPRATPAPPVANLSYSSLGEYARCGYRFYAERVLGLPRTPEPRAPAAGIGGPRSAADRGVLIHALLERLSFRRPVTPSPEAVATAAARSGLAPDPSPEEAEELAQLVRRFAASELCGRLARASDARCEQRFAFPLGNTVLVTGAIDVIARESDPAQPDRTLIVDYKSDRLDGVEPELVVLRAYATQRLVYALAALRVGAAAVEIAHCFLERPERPVIALFTSSQQAELELELERLAGGVLRREFAVSEAPHRGLCAGCPAEGSLCSWPLDSTRREAADRLF
jgi:ATP-dependent exoDNAse (exonuclease V) beta subunit